MKLNKISKCNEKLWVRMMNNVTGDRNMGYDKLGESVSMEL